VNDDARKAFATKAEWHRQQQLLSKEKIAGFLKLQRREVELNKARAPVGLPIRPMVVWRIRP
jgi:hypothetical protein